MMNRRRTLTVVLLVLLLPACVHIYREVEPQAIATETPQVDVDSPVKVHLLDGRVALFPDGVLFVAGSIRGSGRMYEINLRDDVAGTPVQSIPLSDVAALETYDERIRGVETLAVSAAATAGTYVGSVLLLVAVFGSCPTIYTDGGHLQAEAFPNSIVPLFEMRDVDLLDLPAVGDDTLELEIRNEALETHYINHMELLEVRQPIGTEAVPDNDGAVRLLRDLRAPDRAVDRHGRDVLADLAAQDARLFASAPGALASATEEDLKDYIDLTVAAPPGDTAALYLRLRNSLLGSVYFYDFMLDGQGANALNWLSEELNSVAGAIKLGGFYKEHMGLRVEILENGAFREVGRVREVGPIAFDHAVVPVPVPSSDSLRIRLRYITDAWRIDRVAIGSLQGFADVRTIPPAYLRGERWDVADLMHPDEDYAVTSAGDRFRVGFALTPPDSARTLLLATQGYYTEWIRGRWVQDDLQGRPFEPSPASLHAALERWGAVKEEFEAQFEATKIPVR